MVAVKRRKQGQIRTDPIVACASLLFLAVSFVTLIYFELTTEKLSIKELVQKEEFEIGDFVKKEKQLVQSKYRQYKQGRQHLRYPSAQEDAADLVSSEEPMTIEEVTTFLYDWVHQLHALLQLDENLESAFAMWTAYHDLTRKLLVPWDMEYLRRMATPRQDDTIFLSVATYRDENCINTLNWAFGNATYPERLFVGLVEQNCYENCRSGVMEGGGTKEIPPDQDCHRAFCDQHPEYCPQIRPLKLREVESLGPYGARYLASKLYAGENWYMQLDAHMTFLKNWDDITIQSLHKAPSNKPVVSHYPPGHMMDLDHHWSVRPAGRLCGPVFSHRDGGIVRLEGLRKWDHIKIPIPRFAPFSAAGFLIATALILKEVPFDPFLPWIFMGEEIIMSTRFWTAGYDIFSPAQAVVGHIYVREHKPKFWETMHRSFKHAAHDDLEAMILLRIKHQLGYPEAARDILSDPTVLDDLHHYGMGKARKLTDFMQYAGIDVTRKEIFVTNYCEKHLMPPGKEHLAQLYIDAEAEASKNATLVEQGK